MHQRFSGFPVPSPAIQDPSHWPDDELARYGLPPRPDPERQPELRDIWTASFGRRLRFIAFNVDAALAQSKAADAQSSPPKFGSVAGGRYEASLNWSGATITPNAGKSFIEISGRWKVPTPQLPPGAQQPGDGTFNYQCATWIGFDGQRRYLDASLPQIGTLQGFTLDEHGEPLPTYYAWTQWWDRLSTDGAPLPFVGFPVAPDDVIHCLLRATDPVTVVATIVNQGMEPWTISSIRMKAPTVTLADGSKLQLQISGATAEWILERPAIPGTKLLRQFPEYGSVQFFDCSATEADRFRQSPARQRLTGARLLRMYEIRDRPQRTAYTSMPGRVGTDAFWLRYGDFRN